MNDRTLTLAAGLLAIWLVFILLVPKAEFDDYVSWPLTTDNGEQGLMGLKRWLRQAQIPTLSHRHRYDKLYAHDGVRPMDNVLVISLPQRLPARESELRTLKTWLENGNSLLLLTALGDQPKWTKKLFVSGVEADSGQWDILQLFDISFNASNHDQFDDPSENNEVPEPVDNETVLTPIGSHPLLDRIAKIHAGPTFGQDANANLVNESHHRIAVKLLKNSETQLPAFWRISIGRGKIWVSRYADIFGNVSLGKADNAKLLANLISLSLGDQGTVLFDDMHMGLSDLYDPDSFYSDPRLHYTILFIIAFWLLYILGFTNRFGPIEKSPLRRKMSEFVHATGGLLARRSDKREVANKLVEHFSSEVITRLSLTHDRQSVWKKLAEHPNSDRRALERFTRIVNTLHYGGKANLVTLTNLIHRLRNSLH